VGGQPVKLEVTNINNIEQHDRQQIVDHSTACADSFVSVLTA
jgi:hypothetical protein